MILTVTMNPSVDVAYELDELMIDQANRVKSVRKTAGGKGLNVSRVIKQLDGNLVATGLIGGNFGDFITERLKQDDIPHYFSYIEGESRSCIAILHEGNQTEVLENGPEISPNEIEKFIDTFNKIINENIHVNPIKVITLSGSLPKGVDTTFYNQLIQMAHERGIPVLLDCSGKTLKDSLLADIKPHFIKPNTQEISELLDLPSEMTTCQLTEALEHPLFDGIPTVMVSLGSKGALIKSKNGYFQAKIPSVKAVNSVGSGDATIAGIAYALDQNKELIEQIKLGMTCGVLNAMNPLTGHIDIEQFQTIYEQITIEPLS